MGEPRCRAALATLAMGMALSSCGGSGGGGSSSSGSSDSVSGPLVTKPIVAEVQKDIRLGIVPDGSLSCPSSAPQGKGKTFDCEITGGGDTGTVTLTEQTASGKCVLYTGEVGPISWSEQDHNVVCAEN